MRGFLICKSFFVLIAYLSGNAWSIEARCTAEYGGKCRFLKIDSDEEPEVASVLKINGLPTILFINDMSVVARAEGMLMAKELQELTDHHFFAGPAPKIEGLA